MAVLFISLFKSLFLEQEQLKTEQSPGGLTCVTATITLQLHWKHHDMQPDVTLGFTTDPSVWRACFHPIIEHCTKRFYPPFLSNWHDFLAGNKSSITPIFVSISICIRLFVGFATGALPRAIFTPHCVPTAPAMCQQRSPWARSAFHATVLNKSRIQHHLQGTSAVFSSFNTSHHHFSVIQLCTYNSWAVLCLLQKNKPLT